MNFREEYKKSAEVMNPSDEAMERMTKNIMEQVNAPAKKAIPFKKISYIGGAVAACAIITVGAVKLLPSMNTELATADAALTDSSAAMYQAEAAADETEYAVLENAENEVTDGVIAETDIVYMDDAEDAVCEEDMVLEDATDTATDTAAIVGAAVDASAPADKSFADSEEDTAMEEAEVVTEACTDEGVPVPDEFMDANAIPECPTELIYVADDIQSFIIGSCKYIIIPPEYAAAMTFPNECAIAYYTGSSGSEYELLDFGDFVTLSVINADGSAEQLGIYQIEGE